MPCSIKCVLIGYFGHDTYHLLDKSTGKMYCSRDVIFEEGVGHCTVGPLPVSNEGKVDHVILQPTNDPQLPDIGLGPAHTTTKPKPIPSQ